MQLTDQQIKRLQEEKPAISLEEPGVEMTLNSGRGTHWLAVLTETGELQVRICDCYKGEGKLTTTQIRSLPDLAVVLQSGGVSASDASFTDDYVEGAVCGDDEVDEVKQMLFLPIGTHDPRPHLIVSIPILSPADCHAGSPPFRPPERI